MRGIRVYDIWKGGIVYEKTLVSIVVGTVLCMFMAIPVFANAIASDAFLERLEAEPKVQQPACDAFENLMEQIEGEDEYGFVYPEEYGGSYINEDNKLIIELTDLTEENIARYKRYCKSDGGVLEFVQADYSYNELQKCARDIFSQDIEHVVTTYVAEDKNKVIVGTDVADSDVMMKAINSETSMRMKGQKKTRVPIEVEYVGSIERTANVIGGMGIKTTEAGATVGACGTYKGKPAVLTCGHGHPVKKWLNLSSGILGTVVKQQFGNKKNYDYSIVLIANNALKMTNYVYGSKKNKVTITSKASKVPAVGQVVSYHGNASGYGQYKIVNRSAPYKGTKKITNYKMVMTTHHNYNKIAYGDSGGPVYVNHVFQGTISAKDKGGGKDLMIFSPISGVTDFKLKTS